MVLRPLPQVPILISYWRADGHFDSQLSVFFDRSAGVNLGPEALFQLGTGLGEMFRRVVIHHGGGRRTSNQGDRPARTDLATGAFANTH